MLHDDPNLLAAYRAGETWAFEALYKAYAEPVRRFLVGGFNFTSRGRACRFHGHHAGVDIESVVQESFARVFSEATRSHYDGERPMKNYLYCVAKNLVLRELSRRERVSSLDKAVENIDVLARKQPAVTQAILSAEERDPERHAANGELEAVTQTFVEQLDDEGRAFFLHRFVRGLTQEAAARAMGVTRARVKLLEKSQRTELLMTLRGAGYFVGYDPRARWARQAA